MREVHQNRDEIRVALNNRPSMFVLKKRGLLGAAVALLALAGCRSDDGGKRTTDIELLKPSEWFAAAGGPADDEDPETGISGKTRGDISVPPMPPAIDAPSERTASPPPAPAASGDSYYGVRRTGSLNRLGGHSFWKQRSDANQSDTQEPTLRPVPGSYE